MEENKNKGMTIIVKTITRLTVGLIFIFGIYIVLHGHMTPGGGFPGGVIIALSFIHLMLAFGKETTIKKLSYSLASILQSTSLLLFIVIGLLGFTGGYFFYNFIHKETPFSLFNEGIVPLCNIAICGNVAAGLFLVLFAIVLFKIKRN